MKKSDRITLRETLSIHFRAAKDVNRVSPGVFVPTILAAVVKALSPYSTIWHSAQLINELASARRAEELTKWVLLTVFVTAVISLIRSALERWDTARESLFYTQFPVLYIEKFLTMDYADADKQENRDLFTQIQQNANWSGWGFNYIEMYIFWCVEAVSGILGAVALTVSLFILPVPKTAGALMLLNHPLFIALILGILLSVTLIRSALNAKANSGWANLAEESRFGNRVFDHFIITMSIWITSLCASV